MISIPQIHAVKHSRRAPPVSIGGGRRRRVGVHLGRLHVSGARCCPRCFSRAVVRGRRRRYACKACCHSFFGIRIGSVRIAF
jgi:hypothetical protein